MARFTVPDGWSVQAFQFALDCTWYPSSKTCCACGHVQDIGWKEHWTCAGCGTGHQRDDNAAINLARYEEPLPGIASSAQLGPRLSAEPTVRPGLAGQVAMKRGREPADRLGNNPETGCQRVTRYDPLTGNGFGRAAPPLPAA